MYMCRAPALNSITYFLPKFLNPACHSSPKMHTPWSESIS